MPSTAAASRGRLFEKIARNDCRRRGYRILTMNFRLAGAEADIVAEDPRRGVIVLVEVKGRVSPSLRPAEFLSASKRRALRRLAHALGRRFDSEVRVELVEVLGALPRSCWGQVWAIRFPQWFGIRVTWCRLELDQ